MSSGWPRPLFLMNDRALDAVIFDPLPDTPVMHSPYIDTLRRLWAACEELVFSADTGVSYVEQLVELTNLVCTAGIYVAPVMCKIVFFVYMRMRLSVPVPGDCACLELAFNNSPSFIQSEIRTLLLCAKRLGFSIPAAVMNDHIFPAVMADRKAKFEARSKAMFRQLARYQRVSDTLALYRHLCFIPVGGAFVSYVCIDWCNVTSVPPCLDYLIQLARDLARGEKSLQQIQHLPRALKCPHFLVNKTYQRLKEDYAETISAIKDGRYRPRWATDNVRRAIGRRPVMFSRDSNEVERKVEHETCIRVLLSPIAREVIGYPVGCGATKAPAARLVYRNTDQDVRDVIISLMLCAKRGFGVGVTVPHGPLIRLVFGYVVPNVVELRRLTIELRARSLIYLHCRSDLDVPGGTLEVPGLGPIEITHIRSTEAVVSDISKAVSERLWIDD